MKNLLLKLLMGVIIIFGSLSGDRLKIDPFPEGGTLTDIFNTNCLQMTQSQQMLKAYIMSGLNSNFDSPKSSLESAIPLYDERFRKIREYFQGIIKDKDAKKAFDEAQKIWDESREILRAKPTKDGALKLKDNFAQMIPLLLQGSKPASKGGLELLSLTGKLCRGPMKITIDYLLRIWGVEIPNYEDEVEMIIENFHKHLTKLMMNPLNTEKSDKLLKDVKRGFMFYEVMYKSQKNFIPNLLSRKADENFSLIREIKAIYKERLKSQKKPD